jgi:predicted SnoaL-like aldol condensation-catalyzing enzyme
MDRGRSRSTKVMSRRLSGLLLIAAGAIWAPVAIGTAAFDTVTPKNAAEQTALAFLDTAFNQKHFDAAFERYVGPYYRQHNPSVGDGKQAILDALRKWLPATPALHYAFKNVWSDGDRVIVHALVTTNPADRGKAVIDIFRLEKGRIVEHWDVAQAIPGKALNDNTMF